MSIERRLKRDMFSFCVLDRFHFDNIDNYKPNIPSSFEVLLKELLDDNWKVIKRGIWYHALHVLESNIPQQGFKIHISATSKSATDIIFKVIPLLHVSKTAFKIIIDEFILDFMNSKNSNRASSGKFITIYPKNDKVFIDLIEQLNIVTQDTDGPYILSDKCFSSSKVVFYRYGGFVNKFILNIFGEKVPVIETPDGQHVPDIRTPFFTLPDWVHDPFKTPPDTEPSELLIGDRFLITESISFSNSGGVYKGVDKQNGQNIIIKEARPHINTSNTDNVDAIAILRKEYRILKHLEHTGYVPRPIAFFKEWEHYFLIEEYIDGDILASFRAREDFGLLVDKKLTHEKAYQFCKQFLAISKNIIKLLQHIHDCGIIIGDLSPSNIIINFETLDVYIIDFEGAFWANNIGMEHRRSSITSGFVSPQRMQGLPPTINDDYYSLGCILYSIIFPIQEFFGLNPLSKYTFIKKITHDTGIPDFIYNSILNLLDGHIDNGIASILNSKPTYNNVYNKKESDILLNNNEEIENICQKIKDYILNTTTYEREDRLFPSDYRVFTTNPLNLAYGAMGVILYLNDIGMDIPQDIMEWIFKFELNPQDYPPGLFVGSSGISWGFAELGLMDEAEKIMKLTYQSNLLYESSDIFYGTAGWGMASLYLYTKTGNIFYLDKAREAGDYLSDSAIREGNLCSWKAADGFIYHSFAHGAAGISLFLLYLHRYTQVQQYLDDAIAGMEYEISQAIEEEDYIVWFRSPGNPLFAPYWRFGNAGIGSALIRFAAILQDKRYFDLADRAARYSFFKYTVFPGQFVGLSGIGEFMLDMYLFTGKKTYLQNAQRMTSLLLFSVERPEGLAFPGEELIRLSNDYGTGSAGVGLFLNRLRKPKGRLFYDFDPHLYEPYIKLC